METPSSNADTAASVRRRKIRRRRIANTIAIAAAVVLIVIVIFRATRSREQNDLSGVVTEKAV